MEKILGKLFIVVIAVAVGIAVYYFFKLEREKERKADEFYRKIEADYYNSLNALKLNPSNPELKQKTLAIGRAYSALTRKRHGQDKTVTIFDEIALMNDINAACAAATSVQSNIKTEAKQTIEQRLAKLSELKEKKLINDQEFETRRQKVLDEI